MKILLRDLIFAKKKVVYTITNVITGEVYVGSTPKTNSKKRYRQHFYGLMRGTHDNSKMRESYRKYGVRNFIFEVVEDVSSFTVDEILEKERILNLSQEKVFNRCRNSSMPSTSGRISDFAQSKRNETFKIGYEYLKKYKEGAVSIDDVPLKYRGIVLGKANLSAWNKGLTSEHIDYSHLKGIPKTVTPALLEARKRVSESNRNRSKEVHVYDYKGEYVKTFRSVMDIVDYTKDSHDLPLIVQSDRPRKTKTGCKPIQSLEVNNILKVLNKKQPHHKGLIFSYDKLANVNPIEPRHIKHNFRSWNQCYFLNHCCPVE